jgi:site-specific recombinase XerD
MTVRPRSPAQGADLAAAFEDWLAVKDFDAPENSVLARRSDLIRFMVSLRRTTAREDPSEPGLEAACESMTVDVLTTDTIRATLGVLLGFYDRSTVVRTLSTIRGACRWMARTGLLGTDPCDDETLKLRRHVHDGDASVPVQHFTSVEVDAMIAAALEPPSRSRSAWASRDAAILSVAANCGPRATEIARLQVRHVDRSVERAVLRLVLGTKGGHPRDVPVPDRTLQMLDQWAEDRAKTLGRPNAADALFVRHDSSPIDRFFLDRLIRRTAADAGVSVPSDAASHGMRHHYGVSLALRRVQPQTISQLLGHTDPRASMVYVRMASAQLADALDEAGWL